MARWLLLTMCLLGMSGCAVQAAAPEAPRASPSVADEEAADEAVLGPVRTAIAADDFAALDALETTYRSSRARMPSGLWKLAVFHAGLQAYLAGGLRREDGCQYRQAPFMRRWAAALPGSPAPVITDAALLLQQAWCIRGPGRADTVAAGDWPRFRQSVEAAYARLDEQRATASADPDFYAIEVDVLRARGADKDLFQSVLDEATAREPDYHRTYFNAAWYYLPQWGGSYAAVEAFARYAAERSRADEHDGLYARIFWWLDECGCRIIEAAADWPTLKRSMRDIYDLYPVQWNGRYFADLACQMGDVAEGKRSSGEGDFAVLDATCDRRARAAR